MKATDEELLVALRIARQLRAYWRQISRREKKGVCEGYYYDQCPDGDRSPCTKCAPYYSARGQYRNAQRDARLALGKCLRRAAKYMREFVQDGAA